MDWFSQLHSSWTAWSHSPPPKLNGRNSLSRLHCDCNCDCKECKIDKNSPGNSHHGCDGDGCDEVTDLNDGMLSDTSSELGTEADCNLVATSLQSLSKFFGAGTYTVDPVFGSNSFQNGKLWGGSLLLVCILTFFARVLQPG